MIGGNEKRKLHILLNHNETLCAIGKIICREYENTQSYFTNMKYLILNRLA